MSQIAGVFQKIIFESCTLYHIMPFAKIIGPVEKKVTISCCFHVFKGEIYQTSNEEKIVKTFIKHCLKDING